MPFFGRDLDQHDTTTESLSQGWNPASTGATLAPGLLARPLSLCNLHFEHVCSRALVCPGAGKDVLRALSNSESWFQNISVTLLNKVFFAKLDAPYPMVYTFFLAAHVVSQCDV